MEKTCSGGWFKGVKNRLAREAERPLNLTRARYNQPYEIQSIETLDSAMTDFLFTLGCYEGQEVTVLSSLGENYVIHVKDARYSIDRALAQAIRI